jgi:hypothetical protein
VESGFDFKQGEKMFLFFTEIIPDLSTTQPRISSVLKALSTRREADHSPSSSDDANNEGAISPQGQIYFYLIILRRVKR